MTDFTLALALFNFLPVTLTGLALWFLTRYVATQDPSGQGLAILGGGLILAGGLAKASWKLIAATTGMDLAWLAKALFPLLAPGFTLLVLALWGAVWHQRGRRVPAGRWWLGLGVVLITFAAAALRQWVLEIPRGWFLPLLTLASLGNLATSLLLIGLAMRLRRWDLAVLFTVHLLMIFALPPIAMINPKPLALHWVEQSLTALGTACLALATYRLWLMTRSNRATVPTGPIVTDT
jgi:hypothetical protein